jgi:hypothetical protein
VIVAKFLCTAEIPPIIPINIPRSNIHPARIERNGAIGLADSIGACQSGIVVTGFDARTVDFDPLTTAIAHNPIDLPILDIANFRPFHTHLSVSFNVLTLWPARNDPSTIGADTACRSRSPDIPRVMLAAEDITVNIGIANVPAIHE